MSLDNLISKLETVYKQENLQSQFDQNNKYLTANNINTIISSIVCVYQKSNTMSSEINENYNQLTGEFNSKYGIITGDISLLNNEINLISSDLSQISENFNTLNNNFNNLEFIASANISNSSLSAATANIALIANELESEYINTISSQIKQSISEQIQENIGNNQQLTGKLSIAIGKSSISDGNQIIQYNGKDNINISSILSSYYATQLQNSLIITNMNNETFEYNGTEGYELSSILSSAHSLYSNAASSASALINFIEFKQDNNNSNNIKFNGQQSFTIQKILSSEFSNTANIATSATTALTAAVAERLINSTEALTIIDANGISNVYSGAEAFTLNSIKTAGIAGKLENNLNIYNINNELITFNGQDNVQITSILSSKYSIQTNKLKNKIQLLTANEEIIGTNLSSDFTFDNIKTAKYASFDSNNNKISQTYKLKDKNYQQNNIYAFNNETQITSSNNLLSSLLNEKYISEISQDENNILYINNGNVYAMGNKLSHGMSCNQTIISSTSGILIKNLDNVDYVFTIHNHCAAITNGNLYVWGKNDNYWYTDSTSNSQFHIYMPSIINLTYKPNKQFYSQSNFKQIVFNSIQNTIKDTNVSWKKFIKGLQGYGAIALSVDGYIYGCGKNKNYIFGTQFKNNEIFKQFVYLPINYIIKNDNDKIKDINLSYKNDNFIITLLTENGTIYFYSNFNFNQNVVCQKIKSISNDSKVSSWYIINSNNNYQKISPSTSGIIAITQNDIIYYGIQFFNNNVVESNGLSMYNENLADIIDDSNSDIQLYDNKLYFINYNSLYCLSGSNTSDFGLKFIKDFSNESYIKFFNNSYKSYQKLFICANNNISNYQLKSCIFNNGQAGILCNEIAKIDNNWYVSALIINNKTLTIETINDGDPDDPTDTSQDEAYIVYHTDKPSSVTVYEKFSNNSTNVNNAYSFFLQPNNLIFSITGINDENITLNIRSQNNITSCNILYLENDNSYYKNCSFNNNNISIQLPNSIQSISAVYYNLDQEINQLFTYNINIPQLEEIGEPEVDLNPFEMYTNIQFNIQYYNNFINGATEIKD